LGRAKEGFKGAADAEVIPPLFSFPSHYLLFVSGSRRSRAIRERHRRPFRHRQHDCGCHGRRLWVGGWAEALWDPGSRSR
jgi:hypothetical protein